MLRYKQNIIWFGVTLITLLVFGYSVTRNIIFSLVVSIVTGLGVGYIGSMCVAIIYPNRQLTDDHIPATRRNLNRFWVIFGSVMLLVILIAILEG